MNRTRIIALVLFTLFAASCGDPTGTRAVTRFDGPNTMGSGGSVLPPHGPSFDGGNYFGSGNRVGATSTDSASTATERGGNTFGSGN